jgi:hypothetical protein
MLNWFTLAAMDSIKSCHILIAMGVWDLSKYVRLWAFSRSPEVT